MTRRAKRILLYFGESKVEGTMWPLRSSGFSAAEPTPGTLGSGRICSFLHASFFPFFPFFVARAPLHVRAYKGCAFRKRIYPAVMVTRTIVYMTRVPQNVNDPLEELDAGRVRISLRRDGSPWVMVGILKTLTRSNVKGE